MQISSLSTVYVNIPITATPHDPTADVVEVAFINGPTAPQTTDWHTAAWLSGATVPTILILVGPGGVPLPPGKYTVWVHITDNPEVPVMPAKGSLDVY